MVSPFGRQNKTGTTMRAARSQALASPPLQGRMIFDATGTMGVLTTEHLWGSRRAHTCKCLLVPLQTIF